MHTLADCGLFLIDEKIVEEKKHKWLDEWDNREKQKEYFQEWSKFEKIYCILQDDPEYSHGTCEAWEYYLPILIMKEDRLAYLGKFL